MLTSRAPHSLQNRQSGAFSAAHPEQRILRAHFFKSRGHWGMSDSCLSAAPRCLSRKHIVLPFRGSLQPNSSWHLRIPTANPPATFRGRSPTKTTTNAFIVAFPRPCARGAFVQRSNRTYPPCPQNAECEIVVY